MARRKTSGRKSAKRKYGAAASKSVESAMRRRKKGTLRRGKAGHGGRVKSRRQAVAIGLSEAREKGAKVPAAPGRRRRAKRGAKSTAKSAAKRGTKRSAKRSAKKSAKRSATRTATRGTKRAKGGARRGAGRSAKRGGRRTRG